MNSETRPAPSYLIPFALLAISFAVVLIYQIVNVSKQHSAMQDTKKQLTEIIQQRETLVKQSTELQAKLQALVVDLLELSKKDDKAKAIVQKYGIQQTGAPGAPAPAAQPAPTP
ncbi:DUF948 domain-containing protein [Verrucomicrobiota bacterium sgz303538]